MMGSDGEVRWNCVPLLLSCATACYVSHTCAFWIMVSPYTLIASDALVVGV